MNETLFKTTLAALLAAIAAYSKVIAVPILALILFMAADYITGMTSAYLKGELSSKVGFRGILKKLCYMFAVAAGIGIDYICSSALDEAGFPGNVCFFGLLVTIWLILNEILSVLENLDKIGVPVPGFIKAVTGRLKQNVEKRAERDEKSESEK